MKGKKMAKFLFLFLLSTVFHGTLRSEIEQITIRWTAQLCQNSCIKLLERELGKVKGIDQLSIDQAGGQATLSWKKNVPFQYAQINTAMHMVGLSMRDIRIKVTGAVKHSGETFYMISEGDNTRFDLVNPVTPRPHGQADEFNAYARKISPALKKQLIDGETQRQTATIEGPVFMPERMTVPTQIVVDKLDFASQADKK